VKVGEEQFEVLDGKKLSHPFFVHATKMAIIPAILGNLEKFFSGNVKLSTSLFENGKMFFHSNDPEEEKDWHEISHKDFYVALGLSIDPKNFYRNYPEDVGSPTFNHDPQIATKGGYDIVRVETHIKMQKVLGLLGVYVQDLQQRVYAHLNHPSSFEDLRSAYSDTDRIYRLEDASKRWTPLERSEDKDIPALRKATGHEHRLNVSLNGMVNGTIIYNFRDEMQELVHRVNHESFFDASLKNEVMELNSLIEKIVDANDPVRQLFKFDSLSFFSRIKLGFSGLFHLCMSPLYSCFESFRRFFIPYNQSNFASHRLIRFLGPTEVLGMTDAFSYNEFEAYSHKWAREEGARPVKISCLVMSRVALEKVQASTKPEVIQEFSSFARAAQAQNLPSVIVDTTR
jgi:hypothetical protein